VGVLHNLSARRPPISHPAPSTLTTPPSPSVTTPSPTPPAGPDVSDAQLVDATHGWALVQVSSQEIEWTADGGMTWKDITPPRARGTAILGVFFRTPSDGWVVSAANPTRPPSISHTVDAGRAWTSQVLPGGTSFLGSYGGAHFAFSDPQHGWVVLDEGSNSNTAYDILYRTTNGGRTWTVGSVPAPGAVYFMTANDGWIVGGPGPDQGVTGYGGPGAGFYVTHDGGRSWNSQTLPPPQRYAHDNETYIAPDTDLAAARIPIASATFSDPVTGGVVAIGFYSSRDHGRSWSLIGAYSVPVQQGNVVAYQTVNATTWYLEAPGSTTTFATTTDAGSSWSIHASPGPGGTSLNGLTFADRLDGWALVLSGGCAAFKSGCYQSTSLYATRNGGSAWRQLNP